MTELKREESERDKRMREANEQEARDVQAHWEYIEKYIAPLAYQPPNQGETQRPNNRVIITPDGEKVGSIQLTNRYSYRKGIRFRVYSKRIPYSSRRRWGQNYRDYTKIDSAVAAVKKFMFAESNDESRAIVLRGEISHYNSKISESNRNSRRVAQNQKYGSQYREPSLAQLVDGIIAGDPEAQATLNTLIKKRRVHLRFEAWLNTDFVEPRQKELTALDTSKESIT